MYKVGQGILGRIKLIDGYLPDKDRTYLIVEISDDVISILNVSSIQGKKRKVMFRDNYRLKEYNPPFVKPSFVKLDSLTKVTVEEISKNSHILHSGETLNNDDMDYILTYIYR